MSNKILFCSVLCITTLPNFTLQVQASKNSVDPDQVALPEVHSVFVLFFIYAYKTISNQIMFVSDRTTDNNATECKVVTVQYPANCDSPSYPKVIRKKKKK